MKKIVALALFAAVLSTGCVVRRHGHVAVFPPPALLLAGAIAAQVAMSPGHVWVEGHWDWTGNQWVWSDGMWIEDRPGFLWIQGAWVPGGDRYHWRPGHWRPR